MLLLFVFFFLAHSKQECLVDVCFSLFALRFQWVLGFFRIAHLILRLLHFAFSFNFINFLIWLILITLHKTNENKVKWNWKYSFSFADVIKVGCCCCWCSKFYSLNWATSIHCVHRSFSWLSIFFIFRFRANFIF